MTTRRVDAVLFDAYGTIFDVHSVQARCEQFFPGNGSALSQLWRSKQLEYTWLRSLMNRYEDFEAITQAALIFSCNQLKLSLDQTMVRALMEEYRRLAPFPEVRQALLSLSPLKLGILSNGSPSLLQDVVRHAGLGTAFSHVISVDALRIFKPHPSVYQMGADMMGLPKERIAFISSNFWDVTGATAFGFQTFWINRAKAIPDELGYSPIAVLTSMTDLPSVLKIS